ncbi:MAG: hypothetical protein MJ016_07455, partial [Victivallaceae bacterium]|nr:hypothetical protein [Victivallaceae bacterium]
MNRAILIVICDFLVSSMLSMMTGMIPAHSGGNGVGLDEQSTRVLLVELEKNRSELLKLRAALQTKSDLGTMTREEEAQFRRLAGLIAENGLKIEKLEELARSNPENTGMLSKEELAKRLDAEKLRRIEAEFLAREKADSLKETRDALRDSRADVSKLSDTLAKVSRENVEGIKKLAEKESQLSARQIEIEKARLALKEMSGQIDVINRRSGKLENDLAYTSGKLATAERSLASSSDEVNRLRRELERVRIEGNESAAARKEIEGTLQRTVGELTRASTELVNTRKQLAESRASEARAAGKLEILEKQFRNDVFARYSRAVANLKITVGESRLIRDLRNTKENFLPTIKVGKRVFVPGATAMFAGGVGEPFHYQEIDQVSYQIVTGNTPVAVPGRLLVSGKDP